MSFSGETRQELCQIAQKKKCCKKALLSGILLGAAYEEFGAVSLDEATTDLFAAYVTELFHAPLTQARHGKRTLSSASTEKGDGALRGLLSWNFLCPECQNSFYRGLFLSAGRLESPEKGYRMEFILRGEGNRAKGYLDEFFGTDLPVSHRREEKFVLIKNSALIEQFLIFIGAKKAAFLFMNAKIEHQIKGDANRIANCEANNIGKSVEKASRLLSLLEVLKERGLLSSLPQELEETAKIRLLYPDLSISQLCLQLATPITKSGMNHRLTKLTQAAEELVVKYGLEY